MIRSNQPASNSIRMTVEENSFEKIKEDLRKDGFDYKESSLTTHNLNLNKGGVAKTDLFETGKITIQDAAASLAVDAFNFKGNEHVLMHAVLQAENSSNCRKINHRERCSFRYSRK